MRLLLFSLLLSLYWVTFSGHCKTLVIGSGEWEGYTHADGKGLYFDLLRKIFTDTPLEYRVDAYNRILNEFDNKEIDIIVGIYPEDVDHAILPIWHIDYEYPIVAFYHPGNVTLISTQQFKDLSASWLRGYHFERYIPEIKSPYIVNDIMTGFELLARKRVDAFIDFPYNLPSKYKQQFKQLEILPARKIYVGFQHNRAGKKLAQYFDQQMKKLFDNGTLKALFANEYDFAQFDKVNPNKTKIILHTNSLTLLKQADRQTYISNDDVDRILPLTLGRIENFDVEFKLIQDLNDIYRFKDQENSCFTDLIKTTKRVDNFTISKPMSLYLGQRLYSTRPLTTNERINLTNLMTTNKDYVLGLTSGRSYGKQLDSQISLLKPENIVLNAVTVKTQLMQFDSKRFDFLIEYPHIINRYWSELSDKRLYEYQLDSAEPFIVGHMMCNKTDIGRQFIEEFDQALSTLYPSDVFYTDQLRKVHAKDHQSFIREFNRLFSTKN